MIWYTDNLISHIGCAIVTLRGAYLFTDGRYFLQASLQLDRYCLAYSILRVQVLTGYFLSNWKLMKQGLPGILLIHTHCCFGADFKGRRAYVAGFSL